MKSRAPLALVFVACLSATFAGVAGCKKDDPAPAGAASATPTGAASAAEHGHGGGHWEGGSGHPGFRHHRDGGGPDDK